MLIQGRYIWENNRNIIDTYYIRELPDGTVVWVGEDVPPVSDPPQQPKFTNVFLGRRIPGARPYVRGELIDVPKGQARNVFKNILVQHPSPSPGAPDDDPVRFLFFNLPGLGYRQLNRNVELPSAERREWLSGFGVSDPPYLTGVYLTGVWHCDDGGTYYLHQCGLRVFWFGEHPTVTGWANIFFGRIITDPDAGTILRGQWFDVPKGLGDRNGTLDLTISSPTRLDRIGMSGGFSGSRWDKL